MRYFKNEMPDFVSGTRVEVNFEYWKRVCLSLTRTINEKLPPTVDNCNGGLYLGCAGVSYMYYYLSNVEALGDICQELLTRARNYSDVSLSYVISERNRGPPASFLVGNAGVYAIGSLIYGAIGEKASYEELNKKYLALSGICQPVNAQNHDELFVGRAGYLCGALLLNRKFGPAINQDAIDVVCRSIIHSGREYSKEHNSGSPLMYAYYTAECLGAAHGLSAILQMLLCFPTFFKSDESIEQDIRGSVDFMLGHLNPNGNLPQTMDELANPNLRPSSEELVHWCHGGPGIVYMFAKAFLVWKDPKYLDACLRCGELTWQKGLLYKGPGICHGIAGNGYVFLLLYRLTSDEKHLHRAVKFAEFLQSDEFQQRACTPDRPYSLFEGLAGTACFIADLLQPQKAEFPFFDVFQ